MGVGTGGLPMAARAYGLLVLGVLLAAHLKATHALRPVPSAWGGDVTVKVHSLPRLPLGRLAPPYSLGAA